MRTYCRWGPCCNIHLVGNRAAAALCDAPGNIYVIGRLLTLFIEEQLLSMTINLQAK